MNPDNPNFRTPEEEARTAELVRVKAELAELKWLWQEATKFVMPGEMDTGESIEHYIKTLEATTARQAEVIEKLKRYTQHRVDCINRTGVFQYSNDCDCGLKAIEQGEGT